MLFVHKLWLRQRWAPSQSVCFFNWWHESALCFSSTTSLTLVKIVTVILTLLNKQSITWCEHVDSLSSHISSVYRTASLQSPHPIYNYYWDALICSRSPPLIHFCCVFTATWSNQITSCWYLTPHVNRKTGSDIKQEEETCSITHSSLFTVSTLHVQHLTRQLLLFCLHQITRVSADSLNQYLSFLVWINIMFVMCFHLVSGLLHRMWLQISLWSSEWTERRRRRRDDQLTQKSSVPVHVMKTFTLKLTDM